MDIYTFNRAETIQEELEELRNEKDIWEGATSFCSGTEIWDGNIYRNAGIVSARCIYNTREEAMESADKDDYIDTIRVVWHE